MVDLDTPTSNGGIEIISDIALIAPNASIIALTTRRSYSLVVRSLRAGAKDVVEKGPNTLEYLNDCFQNFCEDSRKLNETDSVLKDVRHTQRIFLRRFMDAERRALDLQDRIEGRSDSILSKMGTEVMIVDRDDELLKSLKSKSPKGFSFSLSLSGGEALDHCSQKEFGLILVRDKLTDLSTDMVVENMLEQELASLLLVFAGPGEGGSIEVVEPTKRITVIAPFSDSSQILERLEELVEAQRARNRERRYNRFFRERHGGFLRSFLRLKHRIDAFVK